MEKMSDCSLTYWRFFMADISSNDANYALELVKKICAEVGPGLPGSAQERARAMIFKKEFESHLGPQHVVTEDFTVAPSAFLGWIPIAAILLTIAAMLNISIGAFEWLSPLVSSSVAFLLTLLMALTGILQFVLYREFADPLFKKKTSVNVIGSLRKSETKNVKRVLILSGHHDSAYEMTWLRFLKYGYYFAVITLFAGLIAMLIFSLIQFIGVVTGNSGMIGAGTVGNIALVYPIGPSIIFALFFNRGTKGGGIVPGAADNLSASALVTAMCRFLVQHPEFIPQDTEIRFISFGSEEAGLRGSRRYAERHLSELKSLDARMLNFETVTYPVVTILSSDVNGTVKNDPGIVKSVADAASRAGVPHKVEPFPFGGGGTDAGSFSQLGLKATTILPFKIPQQMVKFYHQKYDSPDVLTIEPFLNVLKIAREWVRKGGE